MRIDKESRFQESIGLTTAQPKAYTWFC